MPWGGLFLCVEICASPFVLFGTLTSIRAYFNSITMHKILIAMMLLCSIYGFAQTDNNSNPLTFSGYIETYYAFDVANPSSGARPGFVYAYNRHNEVNLNIGFVKAAYATDKVRSNLALMTGTYANANLAAEPGVLKNMFEANVGVKISTSKNLWVDAGIFASHIGFESAIGKDCWNLTRSIMADNSPYYESGAKISYTTDDGRWFLSGLLLNGWQRIQRVPGNSLPAFGHQITFKPNEKTTLNSSSFIGSDTPDDARLMRYFHNLYGIFQVNKKLGLTLGFDIGAQETGDRDGGFNTWYTPILMAKIAASDKLSIALRGEYYSDENGVIIATGTPNGFQTVGYSANVDYQIANNVVWRIEGRGFSSRDKIFEIDGAASNNNFFFTTALAVSF
jgi:hypothetical protein